MPTHPGKQQDDAFSGPGGFLASGTESAEDMFEGGPAVQGGFYVNPDSYAWEYRQRASQQGVRQHLGKLPSALMSSRDDELVGPILGGGTFDPGLNVATAKTVQHATLSDRSKRTGYAKYGIAQPDELVDTIGEYYNFQDGHPQAGMGMGELHQLLLFSGFLELSAKKLGTFDWTNTNKAGRSAWHDAVEFAAQEGVPVLDYLQQRAQAALEEGRLEGLLGEGGGAEQPAPRIRLTDPAALRSLADRVGQAVLGRNPSDEQKQAIISAIHDAERTAGQTREGEFVAPDPAARTEEHLRAANPTEAGGMDVFGAYQGMVQQLFGGS